TRCPPTHRGTLERRGTSSRPRSAPGRGLQAAFPSQAGRRTFDVTDGAVPTGSVAPWGVGGRSRAESLSAGQVPVDIVGRIRQGTQGWAGLSCRRHREPVTQRLCGELLEGRVEFDGESVALTGENQVRRRR